MMIDVSELSHQVAFAAEVVVVGAGPAGIVTALELARRGVDVVIVESGHFRRDSAVQALSEAASWNQDVHAPVPLAVGRQVGGTSSIWGGRCVPFDPIDFAPRDFVDGSTWPVSYAEVTPYFQRACTWFVCGRAVFDAAQMSHLPKELVPGLRDGEITTSSLERWSLPADFGKVYRSELETNPSIRVLMGATCIRIDVPEHQHAASGIECRNFAGAQIDVAARQVVVAGGGLESTRLLMNSVGPGGGQLGNESGHLGHWYMAHLEGVVANIAFNTPPRSTIYGYERDIDGVYVRRRFGFTAEYQREHCLPNICGWLASPELADAGHRNGRLSFTYLTLISPLGAFLASEAQRLSLTGAKIPGTPYGGVSASPVWSHLLNIVRDPVDVIRFIADFGVKRVFARGRKAPGFFVYRSDHVYPFQYHGEHLPNFSSQVSLSDRRDRLGMPMLNIDLRLSDRDYQGVLAAHQHWDAYLRSGGVGQLMFNADDALTRIAARAGGGFHQAGTTRMSARPADGVVDQNLRVHSVSNVYVASSSSFVTSGQANSTFMIVAFAIRLADQLSGRRR